MESIHNILEEKKSQNITGILRTIGVVLIVSASIIFMLQNWSRMDSFLRFVSSNGLSYLLLIGGLFLGITLKEGKGARTFIYLSLFSVPVLVSQLGGIIQNFFVAAQFEMPQNVVSQTIMWDASHFSISKLVFVTVFGVVSAGLISYIGFHSLFKSGQQQGLITFLASNAVILIPGRGDIITAFCLCATIILFLYCIKYINLHTDATHKISSKVIYLLFLVPALLVLFRGIFLYAPGFYTFHFLILMSGILLHLGSKEINQYMDINKHFGPLFIFYFIYQMVSRFMLPDLYVLDSILTFSGVIAVSISMLVFSRYCMDRGDEYFDIAFSLFGLTILDQIVATTSFVSVMYVLMGSISIMLLGMTLNKRYYFICGGLLLGGGLVKYIGASVLNIATHSPWLTLTSVGFASIIIASILEKYKKEVLDVRNRLFKFLFFNEKLKEEL